MSPKELVEAVVTELFRRIGHGRLGRLQRKLSVNKNFFSRWKDHPDRVGLLSLARALEYLEVEPTEFFVEVLNLGLPAETDLLPDGRVGSDLPKATGTSAKIGISSKLPRSSISLSLPVNHLLGYRKHSGG